MGDEIKLSECRALVPCDSSRAGMTMAACLAHVQTILIKCSHDHPIRYCLMTREWLCCGCEQPMAGKRDILMLRIFPGDFDTAAELKALVESKRAEYAEKRVVMDEDRKDQLSKLRLDAQRLSSKSSRRLTKPNDPV